jgi:hypothetical protein
MTRREGVLQVNRFSILAVGRSSSSALLDPRSQGSWGPCSGTELTSEPGRYRGRFRPALVLFLVTLATISGIALIQAQEERRSRVPVIGKITGGSSRQAFSGKVQSVDLKHKLLKVDTVEGGGTEIFPVTKGTSVSMAGGRKIKLQELAPGTDIIVYYEQKNERRAVSEIVVLASSKGEGKKKQSSPPS